MTDKYEAVAPDELGADGSGVPLAAAGPLVGLQAGDPAGGGGGGRGVVRRPPHRRRRHRPAVKVDGRTALELDVAAPGSHRKAAMAAKVEVDAPRVRDQPELVVIVLVVVLVVVLVIIVNPFGAELGPQMNLKNREREVSVTLNKFRVNVVDTHFLKAA